METKAFAPLKNNTMRTIWVVNDKLYVFDYPINTKKELVELEEIFEAENPITNDTAYLPKGTTCL